MPKIKDKEQFLDVVALSDWAAGRKEADLSAWRRANHVDSWEKFGSQYEDQRTLLLEKTRLALRVDDDHQTLSQIYALSAREKYPNITNSRSPLDVFELAKKPIIITRFDSESDEISFCAMPRIAFKPHDGNLPRSYGYIYPNGAIFEETGQGYLSMVAHPIKVEGSVPYIYPLAPEALEDVNFASTLVRQNQVNINQATGGFPEALKDMVNLVKAAKRDSYHYLALTTTDNVVYIVASLETQLPYMGIHEEEGNKDGKRQPTRIEFADQAPWRSTIKNQTIQQMRERTQALDDYILSTGMVNNIMNVNLSGEWAKFSDL